MSKKNNIQIIGDACLTIEDYQKQNQVHPGQISTVQEAMRTPDFVYVNTGYKYRKRKNGKCK